MKITHLIIVMATAVCVMVVAGMLMPEPAPWLARESIFEFTAREPQNRYPSEPGTAPKGGPDMQLANSGATEGPPSVG